MPSRSFRRITALAAALFLLACGDDEATTTGNDPVTVGDCPCRLATQFQNLALCVSPSTSFAPAHVYASSWDANAKEPVCEPWRDPQPVPVAPWSELRVSSACRGSGQICVALRAGDAAAPSADDCELTRHCREIDYQTPGAALALAPLPGWVAESSACAQRHEQLGGYLEFSVSSAQLGCGGGPSQVERVPVCPPRCRTDMTGPGCAICGEGEVLTTF